jgi:hypothetical protein
MFKAWFLARAPGGAQPAVAPSIRLLGSVPAPYQTRTCARCGRHTTFVLDDPAGGWYRCVECGRYA